MMRLRRLTINTLPGITPGFTFEPPDAGVILVTGPNAIGKSSLARALKHLLGGVEREDPPALSLEAEFDSGSARWLASRNGRQVQWLRDGEVSTAPQMPSGDQINLYRLSMESLLADDDTDDRALAERIWRDLRGGFDLDAPRSAPGRHLGRTEERLLLKARTALGNVERRYAALQADAGKLPKLDDRLSEADLARERLGQLQRALDLHQAIEERKRCQEAIDRFSPDMAMLKGDELKRLESWDSKAEGLLQERRDQGHRLEEALRKLKRIGFQPLGPDPEEVSRIEAILHALGSRSNDRKHTSKATAEAQSSLKDAVAQLQGAGEQPNLGSDSLERARKIAEPLIDAQTRLREFNRQLELVGEPPDESEVDRLRHGVNSLRTWLASSKKPEDATRQFSLLTYAALALAAIGAAAAFIEQAFWSLTGIIAAGAAMLGVVVVQRMSANATPSPTNEAKRGYETTGLDPPAEWSEPSVREHLRRNIEPHLNTLLLRQKQAEGAARLRHDAKETRLKIERLNAEKAELAKKIGIDPELTGAPFYRFIDASTNWDQARRHYEAMAVALSELEAEIAAQTSEVRKFLSRWRRANASPFADSGSDSAIEELRIAWKELQERLQASDEAQREVESRQKEIRSFERQLADIDNDVQGLFENIALNAEQRNELANRISHLEEWKTAGEALRYAARKESELRSALEEHKDLIAAVEGGEVERIRQEQAAAQETADVYTDLIEERKGINTRLEEAGRNHELERTASALDNATARLEDKRTDALRHQATEILLDEVEGQFTSEREPELLHKAKQRFEQVTAHAFRLELPDGKHFAAWDVAQEQLRSLRELSSGTRMQLLLALRLAWTEAQEQGGESLPLFLDEALTTSDEDRFAVMANTLSRLAEGGERQIFYLSARRHESALWERATDTAPPVVDLAEVRFGTTRLEAEDFEVEAPPPLPPPNDQDAASYAALLAVPRFDPHLEPGGIHLFHLLRNDLELLHRLMATWRIASLGQLESLLASNAAEGAIPDAAVRSRLKQRCEAARAWTNLWRQGRGRPVNRVVLEQSGAVSDTFIDRTDELADELRGDGTALIKALRQGRLPRFHTTKTDELEQWLADEGYTDKQSKLSAEERRRLTLAIVAPRGEAGATDINQLVNWLEAAEPSDSSKSL